MKAYCINLPERTDRWKLTVQEFTKTDFELVRFEGVKGSPGWAGCRDSHLKLLSEIRDQVFMICEDDIVFHTEIKNLLPVVMGQLKDWDMLYLGATLNSPLKMYSENLYRLENAWTTHAIIYNNHRVVNYILQNKENIRKIDVFFLHEIQDKFNCFVTYPMLATQRPGHSDVINKYTDYAAIEINYKKYIS